MSIRESILVSLKRVASPNADMNEMLTWLIA